MYIDCNFNGGVIVQTVSDDGYRINLIVVIFWNGSRNCYRLFVVVYLCRKCFWNIYKIFGSLVREREDYRFDVVPCGNILCSVFRNLQSCNSGLVLDRYRAVNNKFFVCRSGKDKFVIVFVILKAFVWSAINSDRRSFGVVSYCYAFRLL